MMTTRMRLVRTRFVVRIHSLCTMTTTLTTLVMTMIEDEQRYIMDIMYDAAAEVLSSRRLTEFVEPPNLLRLQSSQEKRQRSAILIVQGMGNWGRYGLQPLRISQQQEGENMASLTYTTLKGGHFDGQLLVKVERTKEDSLQVLVLIGVPKKGRKV